MVVYYNLHLPVPQTLRLSHHTKGHVCKALAEIEKLGWVCQCVSKGARGWVSHPCFTHLFRQRGAGILRAGAFSERDEGLNAGKGKELFSLPSGNIYILKVENWILPEGHVGCVLSYGPHTCSLIYPQNQL